MIVTKVDMPYVSDNVPDRLQSCTLTLAKRKDNGKLYTVILLSDRVLFIDECSISHGPLNYFYDEYEIIREYREGETLSITA